jgi:hypothetical protein
MQKADFMKRFRNRKAFAGQYGGEGAVISGRNVIYPKKTISWRKIGILY